MGGVAKSSELLLTTSRLAVRSIRRQSRVELEVLLEDCLAWEGIDSEELRRNGIRFICCRAGDFLNEGMLSWEDAEDRDAKKEIFYLYLAHKSKKQ